MIQRIERCGLLVGDCTLPGERKQDDVFPAHPNGIPASRNRWLLIYATRGWRGIDDDRSIVVQIREGAPDGRVIREKMLSACVEDWDPFGRGEKFSKEHGHPVLFGVPRGAMIGGQPARHGNVFVAKWRVLGKNPVRERKIGRSVPGTQGVEWMQFRLNDLEDDLEILQPVQSLRQKGFAAGSRFCGADEVKEMNQSFVQAVPFNNEATEWADVNHFDGGRIAALKYRFNPDTRLYEWVEIGPRVSVADAGLTEASLVRVGERWIIAARAIGGNNGHYWTASEDPFAKISPPVHGDIVQNSPLTAYTGADGVLRLFTGNAPISPHRNARDPLYVWDIDTENGFKSSNRQVVFDSVAEKLPIRVECVPRVEMGKLLPHMGGKIQYFVHRIRTKSINHPANTKAIMNEAEKKCSGIYSEKIIYREDHPPCWQFV